MADSERLPTVWILGDQLDPSVGPLGDFAPGACRVLLIESRSKIESKRWHRQRLHVVLSGMAHLAAELTDAGYEVDHRQAADMTTGFREHVDEFAPSRVMAMEPMSWVARPLLARLGVELVPNAQFACHEDDFAGWLEERGIDRDSPSTALKQEDFYRFQRRRLDLLMDGDHPEGGSWNYDHDNREPPPTDGRAWPALTRFELDAIDLDVLERFPDNVWGAAPDGTWPVTRAQARQRLTEFIDIGLPVFGPHEDAMLTAEWKLAHSALSSSLNLGLLHPIEVVEAAEAAYRSGRVPIASAEGFIRQVIGWREYVWGLFWAWMPEYGGSNALSADRPVPPAFTGEATTEMACVAATIDTCTTMATPTTSSD
ncbi:MAG: cryptochrome/photolyase family protein [Acidimicrobiales bacterium]